MHALNMLWCAHNEEVLIKRRNRDLYRKCIEAIEEIPETLFIQRFRLDKVTFKALVQEIRQKTSLKGSNEIPLQVKVLCALSFLATGSYQRIVGVTQHLPQRTTSRCIRQVVDALNHPAIMAKWIAFPKTRPERRYIKQHCSTAMLCAAIMTEHWEHVVWEHAALAALANASNTALQWLLDEKVAKIEDTSNRKGGGTFLVPMNGGIWTMCVSLEEEEVSILSRAGFPTQPVCTNYLANSDDEEPRADWQHRMQNLSISCALVCLIVLGSAALVGAFGICKHQISAVLVTGVMYLLAGLFAMFTLMIIHFKRVQRVSARGSTHADGTADGVLGPRAPALALLSAREFSTAWSLELGWGGVVLATTTSLLWILLSKIMRYNPISAMLL